MGIWRKEKIRAVDRNRAYTMVLFLLYFLSFVICHMPTFILIFNPLTNFFFNGLLFTLCHVGLMVDISLKWCFSLRTPVLFCFVFETRFLCLDQAGLKTQKCACICLLDAGIKDHHCLA